MEQQRNQWVTDPPPPEFSQMPVWFMTEMRYSCCGKAFANHLEKWHRTHQTIFEITYIHKKLKVKSLFLISSVAIDGVVSESTTVTHFVAHTYMGPILIGLTLAPGRCGNSVVLKIISRIDIKYLGYLLWNISQVNATSLTISQLWFRQRLVAVRHQAITWTNWMNIYVLPNGVTFTAPVFYENPMEISGK